MSRILRVLLVLGAASFGLVAAATEDNAVATSCSGPAPSLDSVLAEDPQQSKLAGVLETRVVASSPGFPLVRVAGRYDFVVRSWGRVPAAWDGIIQWGGRFEFLSGDYWACGGAPDLGEVRYWTVVDGTTSRYARPAGAPAAGVIDDVGEARLVQRFGPTVEAQPPYPELAWAWVRGWWFHFAFVGVGAGAWWHRRRRQARRERLPARGALTAGLAAIAIAGLWPLPGPVNLRNTGSVWFGALAAIVFVAVYAARRFDVVSGVAVGSSFLVLTEFIFHPIRDLWRWETGGLGTAIAYALVFIVVIASGYLLGRGSAASADASRAD